MTIEEAMAQIDQLKAENAKLKENKELAKATARKYIGMYRKELYQKGRMIAKHERATAIIAEMCGYWA